MAQGVGEAGAAVPMAVVRDVLDAPGERMKKMAVMGMLRPLAIMAAPAIGGVLGTAFGWRSVSRYVLASWGVLNAVCVAALLPETRPPPHTAAGAGGRGGAGGGAGVCSRLWTREAVGLLLTFAFLLGFPITFLSNIAFVLEEGYAVPQAAHAKEVAAPSVPHKLGRSRRALGASQAPLLARVSRGASAASIGASARDVGAPRPTTASLIIGSIAGMLLVGMAVTHAASSRQVTRTHDTHTCTFTCACTCTCTCAFTCTCTCTCTCVCVCV